MEFLVTLVQQILTRAILEVQLNYSDGTEQRKALKAAGSGLM